MRKLDGTEFPDTEELFDARWKPHYRIHATAMNMQVLVDAHNELVDAFNELEKKLLRKEDGTYAQRIR